MTKAATSAADARELAVRLTQLLLNHHTLPGLKECAEMAMHLTNRLDDFEAAVLKLESDANTSQS